jgi:hypothetical protein
MVIIPSHVIFPHKSRLTTGFCAFFWLRYCYPTIDFPARWQRRVSTRAREHQVSQAATRLREIVAIRIGCTFSVLAQSALKFLQHRHPMATAVDKTPVGNRFRMKFYHIIPAVDFELTTKPFSLLWSYYRNSSFWFYVLTSFYGTDKEVLEKT